jgi:hypothetical protein
VASKVIYTANFGDYDYLNPIFDYKDWDRFAFTDNPKLKIEGWETVYIEGSGVKKQREIKILSHKYLKNYSLKLYQDANMRLLANPDEFINFVGFQGGFMTTKHPIRDNIYDEALRIIELQKDTPERVFKHVVNLSNLSGMPPSYGMWETGVIIRDNSKAVAKLENKWFEFLRDGSHRDQLSLPFAKYMTGVEISTFSAQTRNCFFDRFGHKK